MTKLLSRTNHSLDGDLSSIFRQRYAEPPGEYWGVFTPTEESDAVRDDSGSLVPQFVNNGSEKTSFFLSATSHLDPPQILQPVPHISQEFEQQLHLGLPGQRVPNNAPQQYAVPPIEAALPSSSNSLGRGSTEINKRQRGLKIRRFHAPALLPPVEAPTVWPHIAIHEGQQLLRQYHHQHAGATCTDANALELTECGATGLQLVHLLLACADAFDALHFNLVHVILIQLRELIGPGTTTMQRLAAIFVTALTARITRTAEGGLYMGYHRDVSIPVSESLKCFQMVYNYTPLGKFPHTILNQIILDAFEKDSCIHIIDLNTEWRGMQWPAFIHALAMRPGGTPRLRISAFGKAVDLAHSQKKLHLYAQNMQFSLEFCPISVDLKDFDLGLLDIREEEVICINSFSTLHQFLTVGDPQVHKFLSDLNSLNPRVFAISDNDTDHNSPSFLHRFVECLKYYSAVFDALDACIPDRGSLLQIEQLFAGQKIRNIIACEGEARIERHESMASWHRRMVAAGFQKCPVGVRAIDQASLQLTMYHVDGFTLSVKEGYVGLGWKGIPLVGIASWCTNHCSVSYHDQQGLP